MPAAPFAFGHRGRLLSSTHANEVFTCDADDEAPLFIHAMGADVVGVRHTQEGVLALDSNGELVALKRSGDLLWRVSTGVNAIALAATDAGQWAVIHPRGALFGRGEHQAHSWDEAQVVAGAFGAKDERFGLLCANGELAEGPVEGRRGRVKLGVAANGLAWSDLGWWLISAEDGVHRVKADEDEAMRFLKWGGEEPPHGVAASADGRLCAFRVGDQHVVLFGVDQDINCGAVVYIDRNPGEIEFGPSNWMGVGLGRGDGNKIDVTTGAVHRTDPPEGRERNRWMLQVGVDTDAVQGVLGLSVPQPVTGGQDLSALPSADPEESKAMKFLVWSGLGVAALFALRLLVKAFL